MMGGQAMGEGMGVLGRRKGMCKGPEVAFPFIALMLLGSMALP